MLTCNSRNYMAEAEKMVIQLQNPYINKQLQFKLQF